MPSLAEALKTPHVIAALSDAWRKTQEDKVEHGGWIYWDNRRNIYSVMHTTDGQQSTIILNRPNDIQSLKNQGTLLADFHCHPGNYVGASRPSDADIDSARELTYGRLVFTHDSNQHFQIKPLARPVPDGFVLKPKESAIMWQVC
jgi:hypothetical protein